MTVTATSPTEVDAPSPDGRPHFRVAIVGAGFAGVGMAIRLKQQGIDDFVVLERAEDVGGTWRDNTYPGCQCDIPSHLYSYSFAPNPDWSRTYSKQEEIWDYLRGCADRFGVSGQIRGGEELQRAAWDEDEQLWRIRTARGELTARSLVMAPGPLSEPRLPDIPGIESFEGTIFHSARWNHDHDLTGERVAVIGTGASSIQLVPKIQPLVGRLHVFQRTPPWVMPHGDRPVSRFERRLYRMFPPLQRAARLAVYLMRESVVPGLLHPKRLWLAERIALRHLRRQVPDRELRAKLKPSYRIGCKRILPSDDYYPALTQPNAELVTSRIERISGRTIFTADGTEREVDTIVLGTGFHVTDPEWPAQIEGRDGRTLADAWGLSPRAYLGTAVAGFPNMFVMLGPNTGLGHNSILYMLESQIGYTVRALKAIDRGGLSSIEVRPEVQDAFNAKVQRKMGGTVWTAGGCSSWYIDATGSNTAIWPDFTWRFRLATRRFDPGDYLLRRESPAPADARPRAAA